MNTEEKINTLINTLTKLKDYNDPSLASSYNEEYSDTVKVLIGCIKISKELLEEIQLTRNWKEDFTHENGNYNCICIQCKNEFTGHKRRVICKICSSKSIK